MCELFGVTSERKVVLNPLLREFFADGKYHPHGWGMAFFRGNEVSLEKRPECSVGSLRLRERLSEKIAAREMIAHIRLATRGGMSAENTHPFFMRDNLGRGWTLAHNGTIFEGEALEPFVDAEKGSTDSERILCYLINQINAAQEKKKAALSGKERCALLDRFIQELAPENKLNLLICDGEILYIHTNYKDSLYYCKKGGTVFVATRPLEGEEGWEPVPMNRLLAYRDGELCFLGERHSFEYIMKVPAVRRADADWFQVLF